MSCFSLVFSSLSISQTMRKGAEISDSYYFIIRVYVMPHTSVPMCSKLHTVILLFEFGEWRLTKEKTIHQIIAIIMTWVSLFSDKYSNFGTRNSNILSSHDPKCELTCFRYSYSNEFTFFTLAFCVCALQPHGYHTTNPIGYLNYHTLILLSLRHKTK